MKISVMTFFLLTSLILQGWLGGGVGLVRADIADCRADSDCDLSEGECCARVVVSDSVGNYIDSHYCLEKNMI